MTTERDMMTKGTHRRTVGRSLVASASLLVAVACSGTTEEARSSTPTAAASSPTAAPTSTPASSAGPDVTAIDGQVLGAGDYPGYTVDVPPTWSSDGHFTVKPGPDALGVSVWDVGQVPRDPCHWRTSLSDPGPTVDDLVEALTTQRFRNATEPAEVTLGGYPARSLAWSVPEDWVVTGDAEFKGCDKQDNGLRDFVSWFGDGFGERYQQVAGQVDMLWILDVDGRRLLVDATYSPDATKVDRRELMGIVESIRFTDNAA